jgi:hypothetical protein
MPHGLADAMSNRPHPMQASFKPCPRLGLSCPAPLQLKIRHFVARPSKPQDPGKSSGRATYERQDYAQCRLNSDTR